MNLKKSELIPDNKGQVNWRTQLNKFVITHHQELAALVWGLHLQRAENNDDVIGIDLLPQPHFVYCQQEAIAKLNDSTDNLVQEILGLIKNHQQEKEVLVLAIATSQVKLIFFESTPTPPECFASIGKDVDTLLVHLEEKMAEIITDIPAS